MTPARAIAAGITTATIAYIVAYIAYTPPPTNQWWQRGLK